MAGKGGYRPGAGRKAGVPNKATAEVKVLAQKHGPAAIKEAVRIMQESDSDPARMAAINCILDRAYGKPTQLIGGDEDAAAIRTKTVIELVGSPRSDP